MLWMGIFSSKLSLWERISETGHDPSDVSCRSASQKKSKPGKRKYLLTNALPRSRINFMDPSIDPIVGNWYRHLDKGQMFRVVAFDKEDATIELQHFDGDIEEVSFSSWSNMDLELAEAPEDWTGPLDDIEADDLGYSSDTVMSGKDWRAPLEEIRRDGRETWEENDQ